MKVGFTTLRILLIAIFTIAVIFGFVQSRWDSLNLILIASVLVLLSLNILQIFNPLNLRRNIILYFSLLFYFTIISLWAHDYCYQKKIDFYDYKIYYCHAIFNNSFNALFRNGSFVDLNNDRKIKALDYSMNTLCNVYTDNFTDSYLREDVKLHLITIVKKDPRYLSMYKQITKKTEVLIDEIILNRQKLFVVYYEE